MTHPNDKILNWIGPDGCDYAYTGSHPEPRYMNEKVETEYGFITLKEYQEINKLIREYDEEYKKDENS